MATEGEILRLLKDWRAFWSAFGGAMPLDETGLVDASYGPAGLVLSGAAFEKRDIELLRKSYRKLTLALKMLRAEHFQEWGALIEPYLSDVADNSCVDDWRKKVRALDDENAKIRQQNEERLKKGRPPKPLKVRFEFARVQLERHDRALRRLALYLKNEKLHVVYPKLMSTREQEAGEAANAQIYAYFNQVRVAGRTEAEARAATAEKFVISTTRVEQIVEFRSENKLASCAEPECGRAVYSQNLCSRHYQQDLKKRKAKAS